LGSFCKNGAVSSSLAEVRFCEATPAVHLPLRRGRLDRKIPRRRCFCWHRRARAADNDLFNAGVNHIEITISRVEPLSADAAIIWGEYHITGQGQSGPFKIDGDWSATDVRDASAWKIRLLNAIPKPEAPAMR